MPEFYKNGIYVPEEFVRRKNQIIHANRDLGHTTQIYLRYKANIKYNRPYLWNVLSLVPLSPFGIWGAKSKW